MYIKRINDGSYYYKDPECSILHRKDGPAIEYANGAKTWYLNGKLHRTDGPAIERSNGDKCWYKNGNPHREDGPATEWTDGTKFYYLNNEKLSKEEYIQYIKSKSICPAKKAKILKKII